jgi:galactose mutarotase-like enzyme
MVYTPSHAVCVEPQTATPNALALPRVAAQAAGVRFLKPGATLTARLDLTWA